MNQTSPSARAVLVGLATGLLTGLTVRVAAQPAIPRIDIQPERRIDLQGALLDTVKIESQLQSWTLRKICIDGQAYWIGFSEATPTGIAVSYKDGKPEACSR